MVLDDLTDLSAKSDHQCVMTIPSDPLIATLFIHLTNWSFAATICGASKSETLDSKWTIFARKPDTNASISRRQWVFIAL